MIIRKKRIGSVTKYLSALKEGQEFQIAIPLTLVDAKKIQACGFSPDLKDGDRVLPSVIGSVSRFNAEGKWKTRKDLPKEKRYMYTRMWRWKQWAGRGQVEEHEKPCDIYRECYPREFVSPPALEVTVSKRSDGLCFVSDKMTWKRSENELIKHCINLFLELFGECHVLTGDNQLLVSPKTRKVHWKILPVGQYPWEQLKPHVKERVGNKSNDVASIVYERQKVILSYQPEVCVVGTGGFYDYIAYVFKKHDLVILESVQLGNAIYVFESDWEQFAKLSKAEILAKGYQYGRIIHSKGWKGKLDSLFQGRTKAVEESA